MKRFSKSLNRRTTACISRTSISQQPSSQHCSGQRKGSMVIEVIVASILMASLAAIFLPGLASINRQRLSIRDDALVLVELNNVAERATLIPSESLTLSDWFLTRYPKAKLQVEPIASDVSFSPAESQQVNGVLAFADGQRIQITIPSQTANLPITRSLVIWPEAVSSEGATE